MNLDATNVEDMDVFSLPDSSSGHLDNCPLEEVLVHEFGHWIVVQECDIRPDGIAVYGIVWTGSTAVVTRGAEVPFSTSFRPRAEEAAMYAAGVVAEQLSRGAFDPDGVARVLAGDASCAYDFKMTLAIAGSAGSNLRRAIVDAHAVLAPRMSAISKESGRVAARASTTCASQIVLPWSPGRAARLSGRHPRWFG